MNLKQVVTEINVQIKLVKTEWGSEVQVWKDGKRLVGDSSYLPSDSTRLWIVHEGEFSIISVEYTNF